MTDIQGITFDQIFICKWPNVFEDFIKSQKDDINYKRLLNIDLILHVKDILLNITTSCSVVMDRDIYFAWDKSFWGLLSNFVSSDIQNSKFDLVVRKDDSKVSKYYRISCCLHEIVTCLMDSISVWIKANRYEMLTYDQYVKLCKETFVKYNDDIGMFGGYRNDLYLFSKDKYYRDIKKYLESTSEISKFFDMPIITAVQKDTNHDKRKTGILLQCMIQFKK